MLPKLLRAGITPRRVPPKNMARQALPSARAAVRSLLKGKPLWRKATLWPRHFTWFPLNIPLPSVLGGKCADRRKQSFLLKLFLWVQIPTSQKTEIPQQNWGILFSGGEAGILADRNP